MKKTTLVIQKNLFNVFRAYCRNINCEVYCDSVVNENQISVLVCYQVASQLFEIGLYLGAYSFQFIAN